MTTYTKRYASDGAIVLHDADDGGRAVARFAGTPHGLKAYNRFVSGCLKGRGEDCVSIVDDASGQAFGRVFRREFPIKDIT